MSDKEKTAVFPKEEKKPVLAGQQEQEMLVTEEHKLLKESEGQKVKDLEDMLKRLQADFDNFRKYYEKEKHALIQQANAMLILRLLPVVDEFEHIIQSAKKHNEKEAAGLEMLHKNLAKVLEAEGVREMKTSGERFDPYKHDAIKQEESDLPEGAVISALKKGYYIHDRVLRHAMVIVSSGKKQEKKNPGDWNKKEKGDGNGEC